MPRRNCNSDPIGEFALANVRESFLEVRALPHTLPETRWHAAVAQGVSLSAAQVAPVEQILGMYVRYIYIFFHKSQDIG